jgi:hypothetical protein
VAETLRLFRFWRRVFLRAFDSVEQGLGRVLFGSEATGQLRQTARNCVSIATLANNLMKKALNA